jgi:hypothetical protein
VLNYQWYMWQKTMWTLGINGWWIDPVTGDYYTYVTNQKRTKSQMLSYLEKEENLKQSVFVSDWYADYSERYLQLSWDKLWVIVDNITKQPLQATWTGFDISQTTNTLEVYISNDEIITWTGVSLWGLYSKSSCKRIKELNTESVDWKYMIDPLGDWNEFEVLCDMTTDWGGWTLYSWKNIYNLPTKWFLEVHSDKLDINFTKIRWNYRSPLWKELPLIYKIYNQSEWKILFSHWEQVDVDLWDNPNLHYKTVQDFSNAFSFWEVNTSWVNESDFKNWIILDSLDHISSWKNTTVNTYYLNMWTIFTRTHNYTSQYLLFPSTPYYQTYNIGTETFEAISAYSDWTDDRSIAIWIK